MTKKQQKYPVREPNADDAIELFGILGAAGTDGNFGEAIGLTILGYQNSQTDLAIRAGAQAVSAGLTAALRDPESRQSARNFIFSIWNPKLSVGEGENYEEKKREAWKKLPMRAPLEIVNSFRQTDDFADFLAFFTDLMPTNANANAKVKAPPDSGESSTPSSESTG